jgi:phage terminase large subunit-like protein
MSSRTSLAVSRPTVGADAIVYEANFGGDMVAHTLKTCAKSMGVDALRLRKVTASRGKQLRAEPVVALYEQGRIKHVGYFPHLENQMLSWVPGQPSPDRLDAMVWAMTDLLVVAREHGVLL